MSIKEMTDIELCTKHSQLSKALQGYFAAEGQDWFKEADERRKTEEELVQVSNEVEKRGITAEWTKVTENRFTSLKKAYTKGGKEILVV